MLRNDGTFIFYQIRAKYKNEERGKEEWFLHLDYYEPIIDKNEDNDIFTASGKCWQITGQHGVFDLKYAKQGLKASLLKQKRTPNMKGYKVKLAIFKVEVNQVQTKLR